MPGKTRVMGILNVTPDSFSDGGRFDTVEAAVQHARRMADEGADLIDVGGESTRPQAQDVSVDEELRRVMPVIERIVGLGPIVSVDTRKADVALAALGAGAEYVNDVSGGNYDPDMLPAVASTEAQVILMHMRGTPRTMDSMTDYGEEVLKTVYTELESRVRAALDAGIHHSQIMVDPGLGFAKTAEQSLKLLRYIAGFREIAPVVVGPSRKRFVGHATGAPLEDRLAGTLGAVAWCAAERVDIVRVHDVKEARHVVNMIDAIRTP